MPLRKLTKHELFIFEVKKRMKEIELLISNYEASLPVEDDYTDLKDAKFIGSTGKVLWRYGENRKKRMERAT